MREHNKRWLISMLKTSGSKRYYVDNGRYADERHLKHKNRFEVLPQHESMKSNAKKGVLNYGPLIRFLRGKVGEDWDTVYSEVISRIPARMHDQKSAVFWFVADKVEIKHGLPWDKREQKFIWTGGNIGPIYDLKSMPAFKEFYVHPDTNKLVRVVQRSFKRISREK